MLIPSSSSQVGEGQEPQAKTTQGALVSLKSTPQVGEKKKRKKAKKVNYIKAAGIELKGFVDWVDPISSEPAKEREGNMSSLAAGFATWMLKRAARSQGETTPGSKPSCEKCPK